ncbi:MAG: M48 family metallopeptidase [Ardenticatenaceae bacterium]
MTDTLPIRHRLPGISSRAYEHPADRAATAALRAVPMLDAVIGRLTELQYERAFRQLFLGNSVRIGPEQLPHIWNSYLHVLETLDMPEQYDLYIAQTPIANAFVMGVTKPMIVLNSGLVTLLDHDELESVLAHEVGHILSEHVTYRTALLILVALGAVGLPALAGLPLMAIRLALLEWYRAAELSADRAATLVVRDPLIFCRAMMNIAGGPASQNLNLDAFIKQANEYEAGEDNLDKGLRFFLELGVSHPFPVRRVSELMKWVRGGDFDRIIRGEYPKRGEKGDARQDMSDAAAFYRERLEALFGETAGGMRDFGQQVNDWLRGNRR